MTMRKYRSDRSRLGLWFVWVILVAPFVAPDASADGAASSAVGAYDALAGSRFYPKVGLNGMVTAQEPLAAEAGREILAKGGNAVDAAVATGFALAVTHPVAGNIGGGGFMIISLPRLGKVIAQDHRETAPAAAYKDMFLNKQGEFDMNLSLYSILGAGVPGTVKGFTEAQEKYGALPLRVVMAPAIRLAERGFRISYAHEQQMKRGKAYFEKDPASRQYFLKKNGDIYRAGDLLVQKDLANTLKLIARRGAAGFYQGEVADKIVANMKKNGGLITHQDLLNYRAIEREVIKGSFRGYDIYSMPPPSSGGTHLVQMLNILEGYDLKKMGHNSADYLHVLIEAMRRAYADRAEYLGDPDFYPVPVAKLIDKRYAEKLRATIDLTHASRSADIKPGLNLAPESEQTTHYSVMDKDGGAVSVTTTINIAFGGGRSVDGAGFLLNNVMDDFSSKPGAPNAFGLVGGKANQIEPGKRPLSSMTPTIIFKDGKPFMVTGTPGGSTIITVVMQTVLNVLEFGMNVAEAESVPRIHHQWLPDNVVAEKDISVDTLNILKGRGFVFEAYQVGTDKSSQTRVLGRTNSIVFQNHYFYGSSDPRGGDPGVAPN